ncbi:DUF6233 domain-containing protein [Streptomyces sp. NPDC053728]|uniref:DUF6233 domain-containing protein n=1 Tax=Streptomyces sp. NPDC053728 TaxID=3155534 RepID=UPI003449C06D
MTRTRSNSTETRAEVRRAARVLVELSVTDMRITLWGDDPPAGATTGLGRARGAAVHPAARSGAGTALLHRGSCTLYENDFGYISRQDARVALAEPDIEPCQNCSPQTGLSWSRSVRAQRRPGCLELPGRGRGRRDEGRGVSRHGVREWVARRGTAAPRGGARPCRRVGLLSRPSRRCRWSRTCRRRSWPPP